MTFLGIDLGTSGVRLLLLGAQGEVLGSAERLYATSRPADGWSEQNPHDWVAAVHSAVAELRATTPAFADLRGIGVSGHMHGAVTLDESGKVLRPCIMWNDTRAGGEAQRLDGTDGVRDLSGNIVFAGFTGPKLMWMKTHEPDLCARIQTVVLPAGYLNFALTGQYVADCSDSAGTSWLDVAKRDWSDDLLSASGMTADQMPRLAEGSDIAGTLLPKIAAQWGVAADVVVAAGAGDNAAAACGIGAIENGRGFVSLGTSGVVLCARDTCTPAPASAVHTFCHAVPNRWFQMGVMLSATDSLNWWGRITGQSPKAMTDALSDTLRGPSSTVFRPYLGGERTPHNDPALRGSFTEISRSTDAIEMTQAVLEGVAFGLRDNFEALKSVGAAPERLFIIGGGAQSTYWVRLIATVLNIPLDVPAGGEFGAAMGAARLGQCAATSASPGDVMRAPEIERTVQPDATRVGPFDEAYLRFRSKLSW
jgi:xylulokinase